MSRRHHARRRRSYGRRQHELRQRRPLHDLDELARDSMHRTHERLRSAEEFMAQHETERPSRDDRAAA